MQLWFRAHTHLDHLVTHRAKQQIIAGQIVTAKGHTFRLVEG